MADLLGLDEAGSIGFQRGDDIKGKITSIKNKAIYIDVGGKTDAMVGGKRI